MKIVIGNQYQNDEENNGKYTIDESGNINLFIDIDSEGKNNSTKNQNIDINNINNLQDSKAIESDFVELNQDNIEESIIESNEYINLENDKEVQYNEKIENFILDENNEDKEYNTITVENKLGNKFEEFYNSIYSNRENKLEEKYSGVNEKIFVENEVINNGEIFDEKIEKVNNGEINILCKLGSKDGVEIKGARINLYLLNGVSPKLCDSKFTDGSGKITFSNLQNGCYRVISIVDRRYFEKPTYYNWNEVTIDKNNNKANIVIVNKLKSGYYRRQY